MRIVADENMPLVREAFEDWGEVITCRGREIDAAKLRNAEILLVRSVTQVNSDLLEGTPVRFVGSATIGTDHIDRDYLASQNIAFANAPGSNAESVAEYVTATLLVLAERGQFGLNGKTLGVIGVGNVGSRVARNAAALGMKVLLNDPPLQRTTDAPVYQPIESLFDADVLTLHVPLTKTGLDPTFHLVDHQFLEKLSPRTILINTSRGGVIDSSALLDALTHDQLAGVVLDVWEGEPAISMELLGEVDIGTPHIAGYSFDGKARATQMIYEAACRTFGRRSLWEQVSECASASGANIRLSTENRTTEELVREAVRSVYDVEQDDSDLRHSLELSAEERPAYFDSLRKNYRQRREFSCASMELVPPRESLAQVLRTLQFPVQ